MKKSQIFYIIGLLFFIVAVLLLYDDSSLKNRQEQIKEYQNLIKLSKESEDIDESLNNLNNAIDKLQEIGATNTKNENISSYYRELVSEKNNLVLTKNMKNQNQIDKTWQQYYSKFFTKDNEVIVPKALYKFNLQGYYYRFIIALVISIFFVYQTIINYQKNQRH